MPKMNPRIKQLWIDALLSKNTIKERELSTSMGSSVALAFCVIFTPPKPVNNGAALTVFRVDNEVFSI